MYYLMDAQEYILMIPLKLFPVAMEKVFSISQKHQEEKKKQHPATQLLHFL